MSMSLNILIKVKTKFKEFDFTNIKTGVMKNKLLYL